MSVESLLVQWLYDQTGYPAYRSHPEKAPPECFTVQRTGGRRESVATETPQITIQSWAPSMEKAALLAEQLDAIMPSFAFEPDIHRVEHQSTYEFPGVNREPRYQSTYTITVRSCI